MRFVAPVLAFLMATTPVLAENTKLAAVAGTNSTLAPGKPAGVKQAQIMGLSTPVVLIGAGILIGGIVLLTTDSDKAATTPAATTTTAP